MIDATDVFLDTNVFIYAAQRVPDAPEKKMIARRIVVEANYCTSSQVLAEFFVNACKKGKIPLSAGKAAEWVRVIAKKPCLPVDARIVRAGIEISMRYGINYWDGAIIAAAEKLGAKTVYSEDLSHGQTYGSVKVLNPFLAS